MHVVTFDYLDDDHEVNTDHCYFTTRDQAEQFLGSLVDAWNICIDWDPAA